MESVCDLWWVSVLSSVSLWVPCKETGFDAGSMIAVLHVTVIDLELCWRRDQSFGRPTEADGTAVSIADGTCYQCWCIVSTASRRAACAFQRTNHVWNSRSETCWERKQEMKQKSMVDEERKRSVSKQQSDWRRSIMESSSMASRDRVATASSLSCHRGKQWSPQSRFFTTHFISLTTIKILKPKPFKPIHN